MKRARWRHQIRLTLYASSYAVLASACGGSSPQKPERFVSGDTTYVHQVSPTGWTVAKRLDEVLRIGREDGTDEELIGRVDCVTSDEAGGIYFFDGTVPALRYFDADGKYVRTLGSQGEGPGEYQDACLGLAVRTDGKIVMREPRLRRINVYERDGTPLPSWSLQSGLFTSRATRLGDDDNLFVRTILGEIEQDEPWPIGLLVYSREGNIIDSIPPPPPIRGADPVPGGGRFSESNQWDILSDGSIVSGNSGQYVIEIRRTGGTTIRIERNYEPVRLHPDERTAHQASQDWFMKTQGQFMTSKPGPVPSTKAAFKDLFADADNRIWVQLYAEGKHLGENSLPIPDDDSQPPPVNWVEPFVYDVFSSDGNYLGRVEADGRISIKHVKGDRLWGTLTEDGLPYVVSWELM